MKGRTFLAVLMIQLLTRFSGYGADHPNFVVILTDDQSWVGSSLQIIPEDARTRSDYFQTPHIERLAEMGMRFTQGYSPAASCCPTRRSIQTGQTPARHEYHSDRDGWTATYLRQLNIPRMLKSVHARYQTAHFGKWDHRYDEVTPGQQGYDVSDGYTGNGTGGSKGTGGPAARPDPKRIDTITGRALDFISSQHASGNQFYLQLSHYAVHLDVFYNQATFDHISKRPAGRKHRMPEFAAMTADMDTSIGRILDRLIELKLLKNTYLIFLSDNGGRNAIPKAPKAKEARNAPLRDGKHSFYEGGIRVPYIVLGPGVKPGSVSTVPVTGLDILPTLADLAGYRRPLPESIDGGSMRPVLHNAGKGVIHRARPFLVFHQAVDRTAISAIRFGELKLVKNWEKGRLELFDLSKDLSESHDISGRNPEQRRKLDAMLTGFLEEIGAATQKTAGRKRGTRPKRR